MQDVTEYKARFADCARAFVLAASSSRPDLAAKNHLALYTGVCGHWHISWRNPERIAAGDVLFFSVPTYENKNGYPRNIHAGIVQRVEETSNGSAVLHVDRFRPVKKLGPGEVKEYFGIVPPTGNKLGRLPLWENDSAAKWEGGHHTGRRPIAVDVEPTIAQDINQLINDRRISETTRIALIEARVGQGKFRDDLFARWDQRCAVTGIGLPFLLRASHIKPWRDCTHEERLDPDNGILLTANLDALFDRGAITFGYGGELIVSDEVDPDACPELASNQRLRTEPAPAMIEYLKHHWEAFNYLPHPL